MPRRCITILTIGCGVLLGLACYLPNYIRTRAVASKSACLTTLQYIDQAKATWALENKKSNSETPTETVLFGSTKVIRDIPRCPAVGQYTIGRIDQKPRCSFPDHKVFLACAGVVDQSGSPISGAQIEGRAGSGALLRGKTDRQGKCELSVEYDTHAGGAADQFVVSKRGYRTETLPMPEMWPLRAILKKAKNWWSLAKQSNNSKHAEAKWNHPDAPRLRPGGEPGDCGVVIGRGGGRAGHWCLGPGEPGV
jgi:hypothetical protein